MAQRRKMSEANAATTSPPAEADQVERRVRRHAADRHLWAPRVREKGTGSSESTVRVDTA